MSGKDNEAPAVPATPIAANDQAADQGGAPSSDPGELTLEQLAAGILSREVRPRAQDIRRLAEAVLAGGKPAKAAKTPKKIKLDDGKKKKKVNASKAAKSAGKKAGDKKLAKIPGGKAKK